MPAMQVRVKGNSLTSHAVRIVMAIGCSAAMVHSASWSGTSSPDQITTMGNVGIGTSAPTSLNSRARVLEVSAGTLTPTNANVGIVLRSGSAFTVIPAWELMLSSGTTAGTTNFQIYAGSSPKIFVSGSTGSVGIGTQDPQAKLDVAGDAKVSGVLTVASVKTNNWTIATPDYVFEKDYQLASLEHVEKFVKEKKHLPEIPSAKEMKKEGMDLAEMNLRLLKKVEELTLYAIKQEKRSNEQERRNREQQLEIEGLKKVVFGSSHAEK
jgi:hypothetical protein